MDCDRQFKVTALYNDMVLLVYGNSKSIVFF